MSNPGSSISRKGKQKDRRLVWLEYEDLQKLVWITTSNTAGEEEKAWATEVLKKENHAQEFADTITRHAELQNQLNQRTNELVAAQNLNNTKDEQITHITHEHTEVLNELQEAQNKLEAKEREASALTMAVANLTAQLGGVAPRRQKMADPPKYKGDRDALRTFKAQLRLKLAEEHTFLDDQAKLRYIIGLMEGPALEQLLPFVTETNVNLANSEAAITILENAFGDPDPKHTARTALAKLRQGGNDFATYYAEFNRYTAILNYDEQSKLDKLEDGLCYELKDALVTFPTALPDTVAERVKVYQLIDARIRAQKNRRSQQTSRQQSTNRNTTTSTTTPVPATTATASPPRAPAQHPTSTNSGHYGPAPMDLSAGRRRLSPEERMRRIRDGLCSYCGKPGHFAQDCTALANSKALRAAAIQAAPATPPAGPSSRAPAVEESKNC